MKALFSNPPWWHLDRANKDRPQLLIGDRFALIGPHMRQAEASPRVLRAGFETTYPYMLGSAASFARERLGGQVRFRDSVCLRENYDDYLGAVKKEKPQIVFAASCARSLRHDMALIVELRKILPAVTVCVCLDRTDAESASYFLGLGVEAVVAGNYEQACVDVCGGSRGMVPNRPPETDAYPERSLPYLDDMIARLYFQVDPVFPTSVLDVKPFPQMTVHTARVEVDPLVPAHSRVRMHKPERVGEWIEDGKQRFAIRSLHVADGVLGRDPDASQPFFEALSDSAMPWSFSASVGACSQETFITARDCGCYGVSLVMGAEREIAGERVKDVLGEIEATRSSMLTVSLTIDSALLAGPAASSLVELEGAGSSPTRVTR